MVELRNKEFEILFNPIKTEHREELSFGELMTYFSSLCESIKEDFGHSITNFLESGYDEKVVDT